MMGIQVRGVGVGKIIVHHRNHEFTFIEDEWNGNHHSIFMMISIENSLLQRDCKGSLELQLSHFSTMKNFLQERKEEGGIKRITSKKRG